MLNDGRIKYPYHLLTKPGKVVEVGRYSRENYRKTYLAVRVHALKEGVRLLVERRCNVIVINRLA